MQEVRVLPWRGWAQHEKRGVKGREEIEGTEGRGREEEVAGILR